jgi:hypothetical protein
MKKFMRELPLIVNIQWENYTDGDGLIDAFPDINVHVKGFAPIKFCGAIRPVTDLQQNQQLVLRI